MTTRRGGRRSEPACAPAFGDAARSLTWDRGLEMAQHQSFTVATDVKVYFCDPSSPWRRGSNENNDGSCARTCPRRPTCPATINPRWTKSRCASISVPEKRWALKLRRVETPGQCCIAPLRPPTFLVGLSQSATLRSRAYPPVPETSRKEIPDSVLKLPQGSTASLFVPRIQLRSRRREGLSLG